MDSQPEVTITGQARQGLGAYVAPAGDINGDGFDDIVIGAPYIGANPSGVSHVYVYYGGIKMDANPDVEIESGFGFGIAVSHAGDLNNDKCADLMVGDGSRVFVYFGGAEMDTIPDIILSSEASFSEFGSSLSYAGDMNKDGHPDLFIGAPNHAAVGQNMGRAYVYSLTGASSVSSFGWKSDRGQEYELCGNYPNPFNPNTTIFYTLPRQSHVELKVFSIMGQEIATLVSEPQPAGSHTVIWNGKNQSGKPVPPGLYLCRMRCGKFVKARKMLLLE
jgi:hypothetical protein